MNPSARAISEQELLENMVWLQALARSLVSDPGRADDVAQDAWVRALDEPERTTVLLHYVDSLSSSAIARRRGETPEAIRKRLSRAQARLRARLERELGGEGKGWIHALAPLAFGGGEYPSTETEHSPPVTQNHRRSVTGTPGHAPLATPSDRRKVFGLGTSQLREAQLAQLAGEAERRSVEVGVGDR